MQRGAFLAVENVFCYILHTTSVQCSVHIYYYVLSSWLLLPKALKEI